MAKATDFKFCTLVCHVMIGITNCPLHWRSHGHVTSLKFGISDNISETVQNRDIVTMEDKQEIVYGLSNSMIANDLE